MGQNQKILSNRQLLGSLARELKNPLILIARQAELEALNTSDATFDSIRNTAEQTLKLIDGYLLLAQSEYGQMALPLETIGVGSVIYDTIEEFRPMAASQQIRLVSDVRDQIVTTNPQGLKTALWCLLNVALESVVGEEKTSRQITVTSRNLRQDNVAVSVLGNLEVSQSEMSLARQLQGNSHLAMGLHSKSSGVHLAIADLFASSDGDGLHVASRGNSRGLSFRLNKSQQLSLLPNSL